MQKIKIKVCGMKYPDNISELCRLPVDFIGINFYEKSPRFIAGAGKELISLIPSKIKKVGVFVNAELDEVIETYRNCKLDFVQLHGDETPAYCRYLYVHNIRIIKAFQVESGLDFSQLDDYEKHCTYFLFDNKSNTYGGSGLKFDWEILKKYDNTKLPYFLSGGIDSSDYKNLMSLKCRNISIFGLDINSRFEIEPGLKDIEKIKSFIEKFKPNMSEAKT